MLATSSSNDPRILEDLPSVRAELNYVVCDGDGPIEVRVYPPSSGRESLRPASEPHVIPVRDMRPIADRLRLDKQGFELHSHRTAFSDFYDETAVRERYYPEVERVVESLTGALAVIVFDHNVRSAARAARGERGVREPVDQAHNDYTEQSGPKRKGDVLAAAGRTELANRHFAFVNLWRPIVGPVYDNPLAVCEAESVDLEDLVTTHIHHYGEGKLDVPRHSGQIQSLRANPAHRWFYVSAMQPDEVLLLKCYDSHTDGRARFMPHTGFHNPDCPSEFVPRESIEARTLVIFDETLR
jgi:hypothetical protein